MFCGDDSADSIHLSDLVGVAGIMQRALGKVIFIIESNIEMRSSTCTKLFSLIDPSKNA